MAEYYAVLQRKKFIKYPDFVSKAEYLLAFIEMNAVKYHPTETITIISDADDNMLLELASESKANYLVTGNTNDFTISKFRITNIVAPKEYWENYKP